MDVITLETPSSNHAIDAGLRQLLKEKVNSDNNRTLAKIIMTSVSVKKASATKVKFLIFFIDLSL